MIFYETPEGKCLIHPEMVLPSFPAPLGCVCVFQGISLDRDSRFLSREGFQSSCIEGDFGRSAVREYGIGMSIFTLLGQAGAASWEQPNQEFTLSFIPCLDLGSGAGEAAAAPRGSELGRALGMGRIFQHQKSRGENPWGAE